MAASPSTAAAEGAAAAFFCGFLAGAFFHIVLSALPPLPFCGGGSALAVGLTLGAVATAPAVGHMCLVDGQHSHTILTQSICSDV